MVAYHVFRERLDSLLLVFVSACFAAAISITPAV
jgi:hypothetical protein